eukprot:CAMPEP_0116029914 /NCGR_PEP_ID=MMETSP0321-20121206/16476_1 /TAXON_ID=163516 /ORGANISM="Leptocylindrus danicus var. danicus, Strain B650" /LENGTH=59 /DNA_ID=CAMNT_0003504487 /DNA_START=39 /DNA_END=215 /DNA_ORIENTATION=-
MTSEGVVVSAEVVAMGGAVPPPMDKPALLSGGTWTVKEDAASSCIAGGTATATSGSGCC